MVRPSPFCILDEMDAPLDESNINRFIRVLERFVSQSQFIIITHNKRTIAKADILVRRHDGRARREQTGRDEIGGGEGCRRRAETDDIEWQRQWKCDAGTQPRVRGSLPSRAKLKSIAATSRRDGSALLRRTTLSCHPEAR